MHDFLQAVNNVLVVYFDGKLAAAVETARRQMMEPMMARSLSANSNLACSLRPLSLCTLTPTSSRMRRPPTPSTSFPFLRW